MGFELENGTAPEEQQGTTQTQPEGNGERSEKTFTQDEVNKIVSERLARDRAKIRRNWKRENTSLNSVNLQ